MWENRNEEKAVLVGVKERVLAMVVGAVVMGAWERGLVLQERAGLLILLHCCHRHLLRNRHGYG